MFFVLPATDGAMSSWGLRGRFTINRAESLQARAKHAQPLKPQLLMSPCWQQYFIHRKMYAALLISQNAILLSSLVHNLISHFELLKTIQHEKKN